MDHLDLPQWRAAWDRAASSSGVTDRPCRRPAQVQKNKIFHLFIEFSPASPHLAPMRESKWPRQKKQNLSWQNLYARESDDSLRWTVIWDTERHPDSPVRNTAVEKTEAGALDRARHILRMGFVVYEVRDSSGAVLLEEAALKEKLGLSADVPPKPPKSPPAGTVLPSASPTEDLALAMIEAHGDDAVSIAREKARAARTAGQPAIAQHWLRIVDCIRQHKQVTQ